jgi:hypothetical protein
MKRVFLFVVLISLCLIGTVALGSTEEPAAPDGCHWQNIPAVKVHLAVPNGWEFRDVSEGNSKSYEVRPAGPGFEKSKTRYQLVVRPHGKKSQVVEMAKSFVESGRAAGQTALPLDEQKSGVMTFFSSSVTYTPEVPGATGMVIGLLSAANARTGTLYTVRFSIPLEEQDLVAPLGNKLLQVMRIDDEF